MGLIKSAGQPHGILFPEKIQSKYWRLDRPNVEGAMHIWTQQSPI